MKEEIRDEILKINKNREEQTLSEYACKSEDGVRFEPEKEKIEDGLNYRQSFFHDTDKIIHSKAYTRYIDKTQVFSFFKNDHITHRVLHVQFVSKIARVIGRALRLNEDLIEAIALGHDIGHTPYGHTGEHYMDILYKTHRMGAFAHNAQSVRELMYIEEKGNGLNLTFQVLDGILTHNGELLQNEYTPDYDKTRFKFMEQYENCFKINDYVKTIRPMTLEGCVVRVSDIIGYIGRDIEDAISVNLIKREDIPVEIEEVLGDTNDKIINTLVEDIIEQSMNKPSLSFSKDIFQALTDLKKFNTEFIYRNPTVESEKAKLGKMIIELFELYLTDMENNNQKSDIYTQYINDMNLEYITKNSQEQVVSDYICGMTDDFLYNKYIKTFLPRDFGVKLKAT